MCPSGKSKSSDAPVIVVDPERLLKARGVGRLGDRDHARVDVGHVVAADHVGGVGQPARVAVRRRAQQQRGRVDGAAGDDDDVGAVALLAPAAVDHDLRDRASAGVGLQAHDARVRAQGDVLALDRGPHAQHVRVGLAVGQAREAVEAVAAHAAPALGIALVEVDADRQVERVMAGLDEVVVELLDARLVRDGRVGERPGGRGLGGVLAALAVDEVQPLGLGVIGLEVVVGQRPRRRDAGVVADLVEVALTQTEEDRAVELRVAADEVLLVGAEGIAVLVDPLLAAEVALLEEDLLGVPVLGLAGQVTAALEQQDALAGGGEAVSQRAAARAGADDDDVVVVHLCLLR